MALEPESLLNERYRIQGQLGKGGMGTVYLAYDQNLEMKVAVKENLNLNPESERQFLREAKMLASLRHPNLPRVTDHFILEGRQYLVMDYIEGEDLHARSKRKPPSVEEVLSWADAACRALAYLHASQPPIIHRDIKPSNIKVDPNGTVMLVDFGLAKRFSAEQTTTGARGLTPGFSPPEQYGSGRTDARSDQYALAATTYALLTGRSPADSIERMLGNDDLIPAKKLNPAIPSAVDEALTIALSISQDDRFPDISTFRQALHGKISAETVIRPRPTVMPSPEPKRRGWLWAGVGLSGVLGLLLVGGGVAWALAGGLSGLGGGSPTSPTQPTLVAAAETDTPRPPTRTPEPSDTPEPSPTPTEPPTSEPVPVDLTGGGGRIAFVSDREDGRTLQIWTMLPDGSDARQLTFGPGDKQQPRWSPDGRKLLFVAPGGEDEFGNDLGLDLWVINHDGTEVKNITHHDGNETEPEWSPDGGTIAFTSDRINGLRQVFLMNAACVQAEAGACWDVRPINLSAGYAVEYSPAWSPDGDTIAVSASINGAPGRIFLRATEPDDPRQLDRSDKIIGAADLAWSPDGEFIGFTWVQPTMNEIYLARLSDRGSNPVKLTNSLGNKEPSFSPDGQWVAFTSTRDQNPEVYIMTANGSNQLNLTMAPTSRDLQPDWQPDYVAP